jgi:hypothetical protein
MVFAPDCSYLLLLSFLFAFLPELVISEVVIYGIQQSVNLVEFFDGVLHEVAKAPKVKSTAAIFQTTGPVTSESLMLPFFPYSLRQRFQDLKCALQLRSFFV